MDITFDLISALVTTVVVLTAIAGVVIYVKDYRDKINLFFFLFTLSISFWGLSMILFRGAQSSEETLLFSRILYFSAPIIPFVFLFFVFSFIKTPIAKSREYLFLLVPSLIITTYISLAPDLLIAKVGLPVHGEKSIIFNYPFAFLYSFIATVMWGIAFDLLIRKYLTSAGIAKKQLLFIIVGVFTATMITIVTNLLLPFYGIYTLNWVGQISALIMIFSIFYSVLRHQLFDIKVIATEFFTATLWIFILLRTTASRSITDIALNGSLLVFTTIFGYFLIRSVRKEVATREKIEKLAIDLQTANERLKVLDQQKSEFLSIASHQFRTPLTAIKGYASLILEETYGTVPEEVKTAIERIFKSSNALSLIVEDFLDVSRIQQGRMKYTFEEHDLRKVVEQVIEELKPMIDSRQLHLESDIEEGMFMAKIDIGKIHQVLSNLIDNAAKYTPHGSITVKLGKTDTGEIRVSVSDTGVGIPKEEIGRLFSQFKRASNANSVNVTGTGLGLYVAKQIVEAHGGQIWAESEGEGKGSTFIILLKSL